MSQKKETGPTTGPASSTDTSTGGNGTSRITLQSKTPDDVEVGYDHLDGPKKFTDPIDLELFRRKSHQLENDPPELARWRKYMYSAAELQRMEFAPRRSYIDEVVQEGFGIFGGKPKLGKSWWAMRAAITISSGGVAFGNPNREVRQAPVLYLALEDAARRLQDRSRFLLPGEAWPLDLQYAEKWPSLSTGGIDLIEQAVNADGYGVVFIDTLGRVRTGRSRGGDSYQEDTDAMTGLHDLTRAHPGLAVYAIHHNRKDDKPDDYIDALSGTTGISGVVDHIAIMQRGRGEADAVIRFTSRDAKEHDTAFSLADGMWTELGNAAYVELSKARRAVLSALADDFDGTASLTEISEAVGRPNPNTLKLLRGLQKDGLVTQDGARGPWKVGNTGNKDNSELPELPELPTLLEGE